MVLYDPSDAAIAACREVLRLRLRAIPCRFGRLAYFASLRGRGESSYREPGLSNSFRQEEMDAVAARSHLEEFIHWLNLPLAEQVRALEEFLEDLERSGPEAIDKWVGSDGFRALIPAEASDVERELFVSELHTALSLLRR